MSERHIRRTEKTHIGRYELQVAAMLFLVELVFLLYALLKNRGFLFAQISVVLIPMSIVSMLAVFRFQADRYLVSAVMILMNIGFFVQMLAKSDEEAHALLPATMTKSLFAFAAAFFIAVLFWKFYAVFAADLMVLVIPMIQFTLCILLLLFGEKSGNIENQGAKVNLVIGPVSIQPLEIVKVLYVFVLVILLCKEERQEKKFTGIYREIYLFVYTMILAGSMIVCSELGTCLIMLALYAVMMFLYSRHRTIVKWGAVTIAATAALAGVILAVLRPTKGVLGKYARFLYWLHPEQDYANDGYQGVILREALTVGNLFGPKTERHIFRIPEAGSDMAFVNLVQCCGMVMGFLLILTFLWIVHRGFSISKSTQNPYLSGLSVGITVLMAVQSITHIASNIGMIPIVGVPIYFVSHGFTATVTGLVMTGILLTISTGRLERSKYEKRVERQDEKLVRKIWEHIFEY